MDSSSEELELDTIFNSNPYFILIIALLVSEFILDIVPDLLNIQNVSRTIHSEFQALYDKEKYQKSLDYLLENTRFSILRGTIFFGITLFFIFLNGFEYTDRIARSIQPSGSILTGLLFIGVLGFFKFILSLPFSIYHTFVIEEKFGFNKTTAKTFISDLIKGGIISIVLGAVVFSGIVYFFESFNENGWIYAWGAFTSFQLLLTFLAPVFILPLFNQFKQLESGDLKNAIEEYSRSINFKLQGIFTMDGSKRSAKTNAFFTGFGKFRRLVLFDTLIEKHSTEELVSIFAHEVGHYKMKHIPKMILLSIFSSWMMFYLFSRLINNEELFFAFQMKHLSVYASVVFISFLFSPVLRFLSLLTQRLSRKHEYEADAYSLKTYKKPEVLISALKKLSIDNLSYLTPHWLKVALDYTHPPVLERIHAIRRKTTSS